MDNKQVDWQDAQEESSVQSRPIPKGVAARPSSVPPAEGTEKSASRLSLLPLTPVSRERTHDGVGPQQLAGRSAEESGGQALDDDALRAFLAEVATFGTDQLILVRLAPNLPREAVKRLPELYLRIIERRLFDAELTYGLEGATWRATLLVERDRTRLRRECLTSAPKKATAAGDSSPPAP